ncbi:MAG: zf-HC2 domain-containing protein [Nitrospinota bacterium]|nr:MAG: zf-HC2 domain-containing protein [Nitrospinota bacterium]
MKCEELLRLLNDYVDGDIDPALCTQFEQHLAGCDPCRVVVDTLRKTITLYKGEEIYEMPQEFREQLHQTLRKKWEQLFE